MFYGGSQGKNLIIQNKIDSFKEGYFISEDNNGKCYLWYKDLKNKIFKLGLLPTGMGPPGLDAPPPEGILGEDAGTKDLILQVTDPSLIKTSILEYSPNDIINAIEQLQYVHNNELTSIENIFYNYTGNTISYTPLNLILQNNGCVDKTDRLNPIALQAIDPRIVEEHTFSSHYERENYTVITSGGTFCDARSYYNTDKVGTVGNVCIIGDYATLFDKKVDGKCLSRGTAFHIIQGDYTTSVANRLYPFGLYIKKIYEHLYSNTYGEYYNITSYLYLSYLKNDGTIISGSANVLASYYKRWYETGPPGARSFDYYECSTGGIVTAKHRATGKNKYVFPAYKLVPETSTYTTSNGGTITYTSGYHVEDARNDNSAILNVGSNSDIETYAEQFLSGSASVITSDSPK